MHCLVNVDISGIFLIKIDKWFPSTKECSRCGAEKTMLLSKHTYHCSCGYEAERDYNSAINIKNEGIRLLVLASIVFCLL